MKCQPTAARLLSDQAVEVYDQVGNYLYRIHVAPGRVTSAVVNADALTVCLADGRVQVYSLQTSQYPILRYTR